MALFNRFFWLFCLSICTASLAQSPKGYFLTDSIKIGKPLQFALSYRHKPEVEVFFPSINANFGTFEVLNREYFATQTDTKGSLDSVVYTLISFEINKIQSLSLPVYVLQKSDCTAIFSKPDSVFLKELISDELDTLILQSKTKIVHLPQQINYPQILLWVLVALVAASIVFWFFGSAIQLQLTLFQLRRRHAEFIRTYQRFGKGSSKFSGIENVEKALILWKKYIEKLTHKPYSSFTTKEILLNIPNQELANALREIDTTIYGGSFSPKTIASLAILQQVASDFYQQKRRQTQAESRAKTNPQVPKSELSADSN